MNFWKYRATDFVAPGAGKLQMVYTPADGSAATVMDVYDFQGSGVAMTMYNTDEVSHKCHSKNLIEWLSLQSITGFAHASFKMALSKKMPLVMHISPCYGPGLIRRLPSLCRLRTPSSRNMMVDSRTSSRKSMTCKSPLFSRLRMRQTHF